MIEIIINSKGHSNSLISKPTNFMALSSTWAKNPYPFSSIHNHQGDTDQWPLKTSELVHYWQMHTYYIYYNYFVKRFIILSLYQNSFINNSIVNEKKRMYWFSCITSKQVKKQVNTKFYVNHMNFWCINYN